MNCRFTAKMCCVLIVDDDPDASEAVSRFLERAGHRTVRVADGKKALAALATTAPDIVLLDLCMPHLDGIGFLKVVQGYFQGRSLPVVVLTALPEGPQVQRARELGVQRVFRKAEFELRDLAECVGQLAAGTLRRPYAQYNARA